MAVNSSGKVANLNVDQLDGKSEADFYAAGSKVSDSSHADQADSATSAQNAANSDKLDTLDSTDFQRSNAAAGGDLAGNYPNPKLGPSSVGTSEVQDGTLTAADVAVKHGREDLPSGMISPNGCNSVIVFDRVAGLSNDVILVTPSVAFQYLTFQASKETETSFMVTICNHHNSDSLGYPSYIDYVIIGRP